MKIWDVSIRQPVFMTMVLTAGIVLGLVSYFRMPVDLFPNVEFPVIVVTTVYPGASPEEMEDQVTSVLEEELGAIGGIDQVNSQSGEGFSLVVLQFDLDMPVDKVSQEVRDRVSLVRPRLPDGIEEPVIRRYDPSDSPIMLFGVADRSGALQPAELRTLVEDAVQQPLQRVDGVAAVEVEGGQVREIQVNLDKDALHARFIAPQQVVQAIQTENLNIPAGSFVENQQQRLLRTPGNFTSLGDLGNVIVTHRTAPIYLRDVAEIVDGFEERKSITRLNGQESVVVKVRKQSGTNTAAVADDAKVVIEEIQQANPNLEIVIAGDESLQVKEATNGALEDLLWSIVLATAVVLFFFRDIRNTIITMAGLPVIMISSLFFMDLLGISLNQISLLALALVIGLVIDDAIVVRENIMRWIERGHRPREAASLGTAEVVLPVLATSAAILAVFIPVAYAQGIIGKFFRDFGLTVAITIVISTFESLTMAPMLSAYFFRANENVDRAVDDSHGADIARFGLLDRIYARILNATLDHRFLAALVAIGIIVASLFSARYIKQTFLPNLDRGQFDASMELPVSTPLSVTYTEAEKVEEILRSHPFVTDVFTTVGEEGSPNRVSFFVKVDGGEAGDVSTRAVIDDLRVPLANVPGISFQLADNPTGGDAMLGGKDIIVEIATDTGKYAEVGAQAQALAQQIAQIPGIVDVDVSYKPGTPELQLKIDRQAAADLGLSTAQVGSTVRLLVNGEVASVYRGDDNEANIRVQLQNSNRTSIDEILDIGLLSPSGRMVPLRSVTTADTASGPSEIVHVDRRPTASIGANVSGRDEPDTTADVQAFLAAATLPPGFTAKLGGTADVQVDAFTSLGLALLLAVVFIYMVLASQFGSFIQPLLIMLAMPLAVVGAILALALSNRPLDLTAFIGFIMLMGLVTKNSILLVDFANRARRNGSTADQAMRIAGPIRLRPILMTSLALILSMVPIALGLSSGGEFRSSMAIAIMGGMTTSTFLTLLVVPIAYSLVQGWLDRWSAQRAARQHAAEEARAQRRLAQAEIQETAATGTVQTVGD